MKGNDVTGETETDGKKKWGIVRIGAYAAALIPMITLVGYLVNGAVQLKLMQDNVQSLVDFQAVQQIANESRRKEMARLRDDMQQLQSRFQTTVSTLAEVVNTQSKNVEVLNDLQKSENRNPSPAIRFPRTGHRITDASVGGFSTMKFSFYKIRDCGAPKLDLYFINGAGVRHRFRKPSIVGSDGRGVNSEVDPLAVQEITYVSQIPADDGVTPGRASGWVEVSYPDKCPAVAPVASPVLTFNILE